MFAMVTNWKKRRKLEKLIDEQLTLMIVEAKTPEQVTLILELREKADAAKKKSSINWDTAFVVLGNLVGILLILNFEQLHVLTSKAVPFILKGRI